MDFASMPGPPAPRPHRFWYAVAALIGVAGILAGGSLFLAPRGTLEQHFAPGQALTVDLGPSPRMIWAKADAGADSFPSVSCEMKRVLDAQVIRSTQAIAPLFDVYELNVGGQRWQGVLVVLTEPAGRYELVCRSAGTATVSALGIGEVPWSYDLRQTALFRLATFGVPLSDTAVAVAVAVPSVLLGLVIMVVVASLRARVLPRGEAIARW